MPYDKGDFTQQGINGDVSAVVRLNEKRVMKVVLSSDDESDNCDISGKVYDLLNGTSYDLGGTTPTGTINITDTSLTDVAEYRYAQVSDENLVAGNIKKDVEILGITGSYEGVDTTPVTVIPEQTLTTFYYNGQNLAQLSNVIPFGTPSIIATINDVETPMYLTTSIINNGQNYSVCYADTMTHWVIAANWSTTGGVITVAWYLMDMTTTTSQTVKISAVRIGEPTRVLQVYDTYDNQVTYYNTLTIPNDNGTFTINVPSYGDRTYYNCTYSNGTLTLSGGWAMVYISSTIH